MASPITFVIERDDYTRNRRGQQDFCVKAFSGRPLREWQTIVQTEGLFFRARERIDAGQPIDWATLALDEGFADHSHMVRAARRVTGFAPGEFARRFIEDEAFWMYRLRV